MMQINSSHLPELSKFGVTRDMLLDPCVSAYVGAWYLRKKIAVHGNTWKAVGAYHSEVKSLGEEYISRIYPIYEQLSGSMHQ